MSYDAQTVERVRRALAGRDDITEQKMVGGLSFLLRGTMCCGVTGSRLMVRVGAQNRDRVLAEPHVQPMEFGGRPLAAFVCVQPDGFRTDAALLSWIQRGLDFVASLST